MNEVEQMLGRMDDYCRRHGHAPRLAAFGLVHCRDCGRLLSRDYVNPHAKTLDLKPTKVEIVKETK